jgi:hypothetical protein
MRIKSLVAMLFIAGMCPNVGSANEPTSIDAFMRICVSNAPTFADSAAVAANFGIKEFLDTSIGKVGASDDGALGVQVKVSRECVVTTASQSNPELTAQLLRALGQQSGTEVSRLPAKIEIGGKAILVLHDRVDGETFIARVAGK